jgi:hypothetical protein
MVHLRSLMLWLGLIAVAEGLFALVLAAVFGGQAGLEAMGSEATGLAGTLIPAGIAGLLAWLLMTLLTAHRRAAAEAAVEAASRVS